MSKEREMNLKTEEIAHQIAREIGPDISFIRKEEGKFYFTGYEFAVFLGTLMVGSFLNGFLKGMIKKIEEKGEISGKNFIEVSLNKVSELIQGLRKEKIEKVEDIVPISKSAQHKLDEFLYDKKLLEIMKGQNVFVYTEEYQYSEVLFSFEAMGFPKEIAQKLTVVTVKQVATHFNKLLH